MREAQWESKQFGVISRFHHDRSDFPYSQGCVFTPLGIVAVYYQPASGRSKAYVNLDFIHKGMRVNRVVHKELTERGLAIVAHRFAKEVTA